MIERIGNNLKLSAMDLIEYYTAKVLSQKTQTFICVFSDGCLGILNNAEYQDMVGKDEHTQSH